jgi:hypothetical protein
LLRTEHKFTEVARLWSLKHPNSVITISYGTLYSRSNLLAEYHLDEVDHDVQNMIWSMSKVELLNFLYEPSKF